MLRSNFLDQGTFNACLGAYIGLIAQPNYSINYCPHCTPAAPALKPPRTLIHSLVIPAPLCLGESLGGQVVSAK